VGAKMAASSTTSDKKDVTCFILNPEGMGHGLYQGQIKSFHFGNIKWQNLFFTLNFMDAWFVLVLDKWQLDT
jgi:hypothetical protein